MMMMLEVSPAAGTPFAFGAGDLDRVLCHKHVLRDLTVSPREPVSFAHTSAIPRYRLIATLPYRKRWAFVQCSPQQIATRKRHQTL